MINTLQRQQLFRLWLACFLQTYWQYFLCSLTKNIENNICISQETNIFFALFNVQFWRFARNTLHFHFIFLYEWVCWPHFKHYLPLVSFGKRPERSLLARTADFQMSGSEGGPQCRPSVSALFHCCWRLWLVWLRYNSEDRALTIDVHFGAYPALPSHCK